MAEFHSSQGEYLLNVDGKYYNTLDISGFFAKNTEEVPWGNVRKLTKYIRRIDRTVTLLPYTFGDSSSLKEELYKRFEACYRDNLHSIWAGQELYRPGNSKEEFYNILQKNMQPVYDSARRQGYEIWSYS